MIRWFWFSLFNQPDTLTFSSGSLPASANLLLPDRHVALRSFSLRDLLLSQVREHVCLHLLPGVHQCAPLWTHHAAAGVQLIQEKSRPVGMWARLAAGLSLLSAFPSAEKSGPKTRFEYHPVFLRAAYKDPQSSDSLGHPSHSGAAGLRHPPHLGAGLRMYDLLEPPRGDSGGHSRQRREATGVEDGSELRRCFLSVLRTVPRHHALGFPG